MNRKELKQFRFECSKFIRKGVNKEGFIICPECGNFEDIITLISAIGFQCPKDRSHTFDYFPDFGNKLSRGSSYFIWTPPETTKWGTHGERHGGWWKLTNNI